MTGTHKLRWARPAWAISLILASLICLALPGRANETQPASVASQPPVFGVATRGEWGDPNVRTLMNQAGIRWVRTSVSWADVQPSPDVFNWSGFDAEILRAQETGVIPIVLVWQNPSWAATTSCGPIDLVPLSSFSTFVSALARRYNGTTVVDGVTLPRVDYWEFYNEPDNQQTSEAWVGGCWGSAGAQYAQMLAAAWAAVHAANPQSNVMFGSVAAETIDYNGWLLFNFDIAGGDFVDDALGYMQAHPDSTYFDVFSFHYFPAFHTVWDDYGSGLIGKATYYRTRMKRKGIVRPLVCTEAGRRSDPGQIIDGIPGSDEEQSRYVVRLFVQGVVAGLNNVIWFNLGDVHQPEQGGWMGWGLLDGNNRPKPSFNALRVLTAQLADATFSEVRAAGNDVEGYLFRRADGSDRMVIWTKGTVTRTLSFAGSRLHTTDKWGVERTYYDGQAGDEDGIVNGTIVIRIDGSPVYVDGRTGVGPSPTRTPTATRTPTCTPTPTIAATPTGITTPPAPAATPTATPLIIQPWKIYLPTVLQHERQVLATPFWQRLLWWARRAVILMVSGDPVNVRHQL